MGTDVVDCHVAAVLMLLVVAGTPPFGLLSCCGIIWCCHLPLATYYLLFDSGARILLLVIK